MIDYAKEYGIDLEKLKSEDPSSLESMRIKRNHDRYSNKYWEMMRAIQRDEENRLQHSLTEYHERVAEAKRAEAKRLKPEPAPKHKPKAKPRQKLIKAGKYKFTEKQLEIASSVFQTKAE